MKENTVAQWIESQVGPGKKFRSQRALARSAGLSPNAVTNIKQTGRPNRKTLEKLAWTTGTTIPEMFALRGWASLPKGYDRDEDLLITSFRRFDELGEDGLILKNSFLVLFQTAAMQVSLSEQVRATL